MALQRYERLAMFADGGLLGESSGGSVEWSGDPQPVQTLTKDLAGFTPTPKAMSISVDMFIPTTGLKFDAIKKYLDNKYVTMKVQMMGSGLIIEAQGAIMGPSITFSATDSTKFSFKVMCEAAPLE